MLNGHAYSRAVRAHILTNLILAGIILDDVDLTGKDRAATENKLRESERSLIWPGLWSDLIADVVYEKLRWIGTCAWNLQQ
jgi:hypothetical protein